MYLGLVGACTSIASGGEREEGRGICIARTGWGISVQLGHNDDDDGAAVTTTTSATDDDDDYKYISVLLL